MKNFAKVFNVCGKNICQSPILLINRRLGLNRSAMGKQVPDRWLDYTKFGNLVEGTAFIPFKVPLHNRICENLPENARHTTRDVMEALPNVGLVINLTNTQTGTKYYDPNDWISSGIDYKWIKVEGHVTPSQKLLIQFCHTVKKFMLANPSKHIGLHCTHGINRTGYFVCSYMVLILSIPPDEAMRRFSEARGHGIERENYINSIILHDANINLKQTANSLPDLMPENRVDLKRHHKTQIGDERYDNRKNKNFNINDYTKSRPDYQTRKRHASNHPSTSRPMTRDDSRSRYHSNKYYRRNDDESREYREYRNYGPRTHSRWDRTDNFRSTSSRNYEEKKERNRYSHNSRPRERSRNDSNPRRDRSKH